MNNKFIKYTVFFIGVFLIISLVRSIVDLWEKGGKLQREEERFAKTKLENEELKFKYDKLQTNDYIEKEARNKLDLGRNGEVVVILPPDIKITIEADNKDNNKKTEISEANWQKWWNFLVN